MKILGNFKKTALGTAISQKNKDKVLDLISEGGLKEDEGLLARLIGEMDRETYMKAFGELEGLSPDALGLAVIAALQRGDTGFASMILSMGYDINMGVQNENGLTALTIVASKGLTDYVKYFIEAGLDVNSQDYNGQTALMYASVFGHADSIRVLMENGADATIKDKGGKTAFTYAVEHDNVEVVREFIQHGVDPYVAMTKAVEKGDVDALASLIDAGADVNYKDKDGISLLMKAAARRHNNIIDLLIEEGADINATLAQAAMDGRIEVMKELVTYKADPYTDLLVKNFEGKYEVKAGIEGEAKEVLLGYLAVEKEFQEKFASWIIKGIDRGEITIKNIGIKVSQIINKESELLSFAKKYKLDKFAPQVQLGLVEDFVLTVKEKLSIADDNERAQLILDKVKIQLNDAVRGSDAFKKLSPALEKEVDTHASKVESDLPVGHNR
jgi:hypothetical protein